MAALSNAIQELVAEIRAASGARRAGLRRMRASLRQLRSEARARQAELASDVRAARRIWRSCRASATDPILRIVAAHPEGIRLVDIGNELGVDWRELIHLTRALVTARAIEKGDSLYYPAERR